MHASTAFLAAALAVTAAAVPFADSHAHLHASHRRSKLGVDILGGDGTKFPLHILNQCSAAKTFGVYQINSDYDLVEVGGTKTIEAGETGTMHVPYEETGLRLSANAGGDFDQWSAQALFEFGYAGAVSGSQDGTAYDISIMSGADESIGVSVSPIDNGSGSSSCESKICIPGDCPDSQGWTNADQADIGSPADTVCYEGRTAFWIIWCPTTSSSSNSTASS